MSLKGGNLQFQLQIIVLFCKPQCGVNIKVLWIIIIQTNNLL